MDAIGKLKRIAERAKQDKGMRFTSLAHLINEESLAGCYGELQKGKEDSGDTIHITGSTKHFTLRRTGHVQHQRNF